MKILMVNKFLVRRGGVETYVTELGKMLAAADHEVQYFGMDSEGRTLGNDWGIYVPNVDLGGRQGPTRLLDVPCAVCSRENARRMSQLLEVYEPDVVHFNNLHYHLTPSVIESAAVYRAQVDHPVSLVMTMHDYHCAVPCDGCMDNSSYEVCDRCLDGRYLRCVVRGCVRGGRAKSIVAALESFYWHHSGTYRLLDRVICPSLCVKQKFDRLSDFV